MPDYPEDAFTNKEILLRLETKLDRHMEKHDERMEEVNERLHIAESDIKVRPTRVEILGGLVTATLIVLAVIRIVV